MLGNLKDKVMNKAQKNDLTDVEVEVDEINEDEQKISISEKMKQAATDGINKVKEKTSDIDLSKIDISKTLMSFAKKSVATVEELDKELLEVNSNYEINNFVISSNIGLHIGFKLDITFVKTKTAKEIRSKQIENATGKCPYCQKEWKIPKSSIAGKAKAKLRCASCQKIFTVDGKTFKVIKEN